MMERLIRAGMDIARLNLSHGTHHEHARHIKTIRTASQRLGATVAIMVDLPGPKYRTGQIPGGSMELTRGSTITLTTKELASAQGKIPVTPLTLSREIKAGNTILIDDGAMRVKVQAVQGDDITCNVITGGTLTSRRSVVVPGMAASLPFITDELQRGIDFVAEEKPDFVALSFVGRPSDVLQVRELLMKRGLDTPIIAKIEQRQALANFDEILAISDGIMVARGDLGVEIPLRRLPMVQKALIRKSNDAGKPVITATQMLESMVNAPSPTRAEVTDVANAILDGSDAIMLSAETSIGKRPDRVVTVMAQIAQETEAHLPYEKLLEEWGRRFEPRTDEAISYDACRTAHQLGAVAIVAFTEAGSTPRRVSKYRPSVPILAITRREKVAQQLALSWGVQPCLIGTVASVEEIFSSAIEAVLQQRLAKKGDTIVITAGLPLGVAGNTNLLKVEKIP